MQSCGGFLRSPGGLRVLVCVRPRGPVLCVSVRVSFIRSPVLVLSPCVCGRRLPPDPDLSLSVRFGHSCVCVRPGPGPFVLLFSVVGHSVTGGQTHTSTGGHVGSGGQVLESVTSNVCPSVQQTKQAVTTVRTSTTFIVATYFKATCYDFSLFHYISL